VPPCAIARPSRDVSARTYRRGRAVALPVALHTDDADQQNQIGRRPSPIIRTQTTGTYPHVRTPVTAHTCSGGPRRSIQRADHRGHCVTEVRGRSRPMSVPVTATTDRVSECHLFASSSDDSS